MQAILTNTEEEAQAMCLELDNRMGLPIPGTTHYTDPAKHIDGSSWIVLIPDETALYIDLGEIIIVTASDFYKEILLETDI